MRTTAGDYEEEILVGIAMKAFEKDLEAALSDMEPGMWYSVRLNREVFMGHGPEDTVKISWEMNPITVEQALCVRSEDFFLKENETSFFQKIKNCLAYLMDKDGDRIVVRHENE